jgi:hypothetical protein
MTRRGGEVFYPRKWQTAAGWFKSSIQKNETVPPPTANCLWEPWYSDVEYKSIKELPFLRLMLSCGHERTPFGEPLCSHVRLCREPWLHYVRWYTGSGLDTELLCVPCAEARENGLQVEAETVCQECFEEAVTEFCDFLRTGGKPEIRIQSAPFNGALKETAIPKEFGKILDIAPSYQESRSTWLMLAEDGGIFRLDASNGGAWSRLASAILPAETERDPYAGHMLTRRLHASGRSEFAAIVSDYGCKGQLVDLRSGQVTLTLDGGDYYPETVPFSFAFAEWQGRIVAIHRTAWNRLDVSDAATGRLLTQRGPTSYRHGEEKPPHYLDYFHGAVYLNPGGTRILDDGWVWHPMGIPVVWSRNRWLSENPWEPEDGPTRKGVCARNAYWDHGIAWLDEDRVVIGGIGDDKDEMIDGARVFDITSTGSPSPRWRWQGSREVTAFAGPAGKFFSDGKSLYSADKTGLSRWDPRTGSRTGCLKNFQPTHHHSGARELVQLSDGVLVRWSTTE